MCVWCFKLGRFEFLDTFRFIKYTLVKTITELRSQELENEKIKGFIIK
jgi:hypothetical protein